MALYRLTVLKLSFSALIQRSNLLSLRARKNRNFLHLQHENRREKNRDGRFSVAVPAH